MVKFVFWGDPGHMTADAPKVPHFVFVQDLQSAQDVIRTAEENAVLFVDANLIVDKPDGLATALKERKPTVAVVYEGLPNVEIIRIMIQHSINHVIPRTSENSRSFLNQLLLQTQSLAPEHFQPKSLTNRQDIHLTHSQQCDNVYAEIAKHVQNLNCFPGFEGIVLTSASELLTNAFYNGKRNTKTGSPLVTDRRVKFPLDAGESISITYGNDKDYFWLMVCDPFGSLDRPTLVKALNRAAIEKTPRLNSPGGAGLGMLMLFDWSTELNFFLNQNRSTCVACKFRITNRNRVFESEPSAIHIFESSECVTAS